MRTRVFKSGKGMAVRIPAQIAYADTNIDLEITRCGDVITIQPAKCGDMRKMVAQLRKLPKPKTVELLDRTELPDRGHN